MLLEADGSDFSLHDTGVNIRICVFSGTKWIKVFKIMRSILPAM